MTFRVQVIADKLTPAARRLRRAIPGIADQLVRKMAFDIVAEVAELVPVDTGRYRAGWRASLSVLGSDGEGDTVSVFESGDRVGIAVVNPVEYAPFIEYGTATRPPGNPLAIAIETVRGQVPAELLGALAQNAWGGP